MIPRSIALRPPRLRIGIGALVSDGGSVVWLAYLVALLAAELLINLWYLRLAIVLHTAILVAALGQASVAAAAERRLLVALSLAPQVRLLSLALPLAALPPVYAWALTGLCLAVAAWSVVWQLGLSRTELGLRIGDLEAQLVIALLGLPLGVAGYLLLRPLPVVSELSLRAMAGPALILLVFAGFLEELIFRGILQSAAREVHGRRGAIYVASLSAALSVGFLSVPYTALVFAASLGFGGLVARTNSLLGVSLAHGLASILMLLVIPSL